MPRLFTATLMLLALTLCAASGARAQTAADAERTLAEAAAQPETVQTDSGLLYSVTREGPGPAPEAHETVVIDYVMRLADGTEVERSTDGSAVFGISQMIPGLREGILGMRAGGARTFTIPPELAYGATGIPSGPIPPHAVLIVDVELLGFVDTD